MKNLLFISSSREDLKKFPKEVTGEIGHALHLAQENMKPTNAKPLKGFGGATVLEIVDNYDTNTYRAVYTVKFGNYLFVLHCFQKKSPKGIKTAQKDIETIKRRLKIAKEYYNDLLK